MHPIVYDLDMNPVAYLENASAINAARPENKLWTGGFTLPLDDPKNEWCKPFYRIRLYDNGEEIGLFRIMKRTKKKKGEKLIVYQLEHVLGTLIDPAIDGYHQIDNQTTTYNINYLLGFQKQQDWVLGQCDFEYLFSYKYEKVHAVYNALMSVFKPFPDPYHIGWDTTVYPWKLNILKAETEPTARIRAGYNMKGIEKDEDFRQVVTRVKAYGYGEGVNQLETPWYEAEQSLVDEYGTVEYPLVDRSIEDQGALEAWAKKYLNEYKIPPVTYQIEAAEVYAITGLDIDKFRPGQIVRVYDADMGVEFDARVEKVNKSDVTGKPGDVGLELNRKVKDIADSQKEMRDRQRVEETYSMGSTNIYAYSYDDNCDENYPAIIRFYVPPETVKNNKVYVSFQTTKFRRYVKSMESAGQTVISTTSGPSSRQTTASGGGQTSGPSSRTTTASGGGDTSAAGGNHRHEMWAAVGFGAPSSGAYTVFDTYDGTFYVPGEAPAGKSYFTKGASGDHTHGLPTHTHGMDHTHNLPTHTHGMDHTHQVKAEIEGHTHPQVPGIWEAPNLPNSISLEVDGNSVPNVNLNEDNFNIKPYMSKDSGGEIQVGTTHEIKIFPSDLARISANVFVQLFIQSRI